MEIVDKINTNQSILGKDLLAWIMASASTKTEEENEIADKLYYKYIIDRQGNHKNKIFPDVYYYVNYNNKVNKNVYLAYIVRDKIKSPKRIPAELALINLVGSQNSYLGSVICEWAYFQNTAPDNPYYAEGHELVKRYLENKHPLQHHAYYYVAQTARGIRIFRDLEKSPRPIIGEGEKNGKH